MLKLIVLLVCCGFVFSEDAAEAEALKNELEGFSLEKKICIGEKVAPILEALIEKNKDNNEIMESLTKDGGALSIGTFFGLASEDSSGETFKSLVQGLKDSFSVCA
nr:venom peptide [Acharia stimulea]